MSEVTPFWWFWQYLLLLCSDFHQIFISISVCGNLWTKLHFTVHRFFSRILTGFPIGKADDFNWIKIDVFPFILFLQTKVIKYKSVEQEKCEPRYKYDCHIGEKYLPNQSHYIKVVQGGVFSRARHNWLWIYLLLGSYYMYWSYYKTVLIFSGSYCSFSILHYSS